MKTIGQILAEARVEKKLSVESLEKKTKIRASFIRNIEKESWESLPAFPTVLGFVRSLASALDIDPQTASAVLKRDYPPKKLSITPKPDIPNKVSMSPKIAFFAGVGFFALLIIGYLAFQYNRFVSPPTLKVESPKDAQIVTGGSVLVFGSTDRDAKITVNNQPVLVTLDGNFSVTISVVPETKEITVKAFSRSGKETVINRRIEVQ
jgi:cytoskeletal protein RodZ